MHKENLFQTCICFALLPSWIGSIFFFNFYIYFIYLFIFGCVGLHCCVRAFLQLRREGATLRCGARASHCSGFSCYRARTLDARASVVVVCGLSSRGSRAPERRLSSCGSRAQLLHGMWDLPGSGLKPVSPALAGGFSTTVPPGKLWKYILIGKNYFDPRTNRLDLLKCNESDPQSKVKFHKYDLTIELTLMRF